MSGHGQRSTPSRRHAVFSVFGAVAITFVLVYSLSRASWTDFGEPTPHQRSSTSSTSLTSATLDECLLRVSDGHWELSTEGCPGPSPGILHSCELNSTGLPRRWASSAPEGCLDPYLVQRDVAAMFSNKTIAFVGDSHLRKLYNFMVEFLSDDQITVPPVTDQKKHVDFATTVKTTGTRLEFYWRAEVRSTMAAMNEFLDDHPDLIVCDASAHQAKWARDFEAFLGELPGLAQAVTEFHERFPTTPIVWMISPPFKEPFDLSNPDTEYFYSLRKFNDALWGAGVFVPDGPVVPIDMYRIAEGCMDWCYRDNTHVLPSVNVLLLQMINSVYARHKR